MQHFTTGFAENSELMFDNVSKFSQLEIAAQSKMKDKQCADPRDRIENCEHLRKLEAERHLELKVRSSVSLAFGERGKIAAWSMNLQGPINMSK